MLILTDSMAAKATAPTVTDRARHQGCTLPTRSPVTRHRNQLGKGSHRNQRQRAGRPASNLRVFPRRDLRGTQDRHRRRHQTDSQGGKGEREKSSRLRTRRQSLMGAMGPRSLHVVQNGERTTTAMAPWIHKIGKADDPSCPCGAAVQSGEHIVWHCNLHRYERARNRITTMTREGEWGDLDGKIWVPNEEAGDDKE